MHDVINVIEKVADDLAWRDIGKEAYELSLACLDTYKYVKRAQHKLPQVDPGYGEIWYHPEDEILYFNVGINKDFAKVAEFKSALHKAYNVDHLEFDWTYRPERSEGWIKFNFYSPAQLFSKSAEPSATNEGTTPFKQLAQLGGWKEGPVTAVLGGPNTFSSTLASGLLGAGAGYGTGLLLEHLLPEEYVQRGRLRKTLGILGGITGAVPGAWYGYAKHRAEQQNKLASVLDELLSEDCALNEEFAKAADQFSNKDLEPIYTDDFNNILMSPTDGYTPLTTRMAISGFVDASAYRHGNPEVTTPLSMANLIVGSGKGLAQGYLVGRTLGALAGLTEPAQQKLQQLGVWTGILNSVVPKIYS